VKSALVLSEISKGYGGVRALEAVSLSVDFGEVVGLIGGNGAGKTTLFDVAGGHLGADRGRVVVSGTDVTTLPAFRIARLGLGRLFQEVRLARSMSVRDNLAFACERRAHPLGAPSDWRTVLHPAGVDPGSSERAAALSYGQQKLLAIAMCLASRPRLLMLDEPFAGLGAAMVEIVVSTVVQLAETGAAVVIVDHNMQALRAVAPRMIALASGRVIADGDAAGVLASSVVLDAYLSPVGHG
jgi:ABC-type branched-subunit amino acid transport system ATPase component